MTTKYFGPYSLTVAFLLGREGYAYRAALHLSGGPTRVIDEIGTTESEFLADGESYAADRFINDWLDGDLPAH